MSLCNWRASSRPYGASHYKYRIYLFVGTDILRTIIATMSLKETCLLNIHVRICDIRLKKQTEVNFDFQSGPGVACAILNITVDLCTATLIKMQLFKHP